MAVEQNRPRGRPPTGRLPMRGVRMPAELEAGSGGWIDRQPDPKPCPERSGRASRSETIRRLIERGRAGSDR